MTPRPTGPIEPLLPPPGRFDQVLREARSRRYRRATAVTGVAGVFLAGIMGGLALGGTARLPDRLLRVASALPGLGSTPTAAPTHTSTSTKAGRVPSTTRTTHRHEPTRRAATTGPDPRPVAVVRGKAVDTAGAPVIGAYVYTGHYRAGDFIPADLPAARTGSAGKFTIACQGPVLLTPWPLNRPLQTGHTAQVAATLVPAPVCSRSTDAQVTTMPAGSTIEGRVRTDVGCAGEDLRATLLLARSPATAVRLTHLHEGDAFRLTGIPAGSHVLRVHGKRYDVTVPSAAATVTRNVTVRCPDVPTPTEIPSVTPSPAPTPSETESPSPTTTPTATASPSPSGTNRPH